MVLIGVYILYVAAIAIYPVPNQNLTLVVETKNSVENIKISYDEIIRMKETKEFSISVPGVHETGINEIRIYRKYKSIAVGKITAVELPIYGTIQENTIWFNEQACKLVKELSETYFMERIINAEIGLIVAILLWIILNAFEEKFTPNNRYNHGPIKEIKRFFGDIVKYREYMVFSAKADLNAEVANSYLNRLWWLLEPFFNMLVYVIVFGKVMGNSIQNYATFVFAALLMWNYFAKTLNYSVKCVRNNRDIVTKIYVPKYVLLLSNMILNFIKLLFSLIILVVMLCIFRVSIGWQVIYVICAYAMMLLFAFGAGMIFLHFGVFIDDLSYAVGILINILMFLSGIFYDMLTSITAPLNTIMLSINPCAIFIDSMRNSLLNKMITNVPTLIIWTLLSVLLGYIGIHIVYKNENGYVKVI